jgi:hypothetical protein
VEEKEEEEGSQEASGEESRSCSPSQMYESIETFGNRAPFSREFLHSVTIQPQLTNQRQKHQKISQLSDSPADPDPSSRHRPHPQSPSESHIDEEVTRIVNKVLNRSKPVEWLKQSSLRKDNDNLSKIDRINKELLG